MRERPDGGEKGGAGEKGDGHTLRVRSLGEGEGSQSPLEEGGGHCTGKY